MTLSMQSNPENLDKIKLIIQLSRFKKIYTLIVCAILPKIIKPWLLNLIGHKVCNKSQIHCSFIWTDCPLYLEKNSKIGFFNYIQCFQIKLKNKSYIGAFNYIKGQFIININNEGAIGNRNILTRHSDCENISNLEIGNLAKITSSHRIDLMDSINIGDYSTLAGANSQIWTHGYIHHTEGKDRYEIRGHVIIGKNCYIGSMCCIGPGTQIEDQTSISSLQSVSGHWESGHYPNKRSVKSNLTLQDRLDKFEIVTNKTTNYRKKNVKNKPTTKEQNNEI